MMELTRRGFLVAIAAAIAVPAMPKIITADTSFILRDQDIVLSRTLVLDTHDGFLITNCRFTLADDFDGHIMIDCIAAKNGSIINCVFIGDGRVTPCITM